MKRIVLTCVCGMVFSISAQTLTDGNFLYTVSYGEATVVGINNSTNTLLIPATLGGVTVRRIGESAFDYSSSLKTVAIPDTVSSIGNSAFYSCSGITNLSLGCGVITIGDTAFKSCSSITELRLPDSLQSIGTEGFYYSSGIASVIAGTNLATIGKDAFYGTAWYNAKPNGLVYVGSVAYKYKGTPPANVIISNSVHGVAGAAFAGCSTLKSVGIPDTVTHIGNEAFRDCGLTNLVLGQSVTYIGNQAFYSCDYIKQLDIHDRVWSIGDEAFRFSSGITNLYLGTNINVIGDNAFDYVSNIKEVRIPDSVRVVGNEAFSDCNVSVRRSSFGEFEGRTAVAIFV